MSTRSILAFSELFCSRFRPPSNFNHVFQPHRLSTLQWQQYRCAGHSHWQNVRHTKEANDRAKERLISQYIRSVLRAIKRGNGVRDPNINQFLASVLADAKASSVPLAALERAIKAEKAIEPYIVEVQAPGGLFILIESTAKAPNSERQLIASVIKKFGCSLAATQGSICSEFFDHVGLLLADGKRSSSLTDLDTATHIGIEAGVLDVVQASPESFEFRCEPQLLTQVQDYLENEHKVVILDAMDVYESKKPVVVSADTRLTLRDMYDKIRSHSDYVTRIFDNVKNEDD